MATYSKFAVKYNDYDGESSTVTGISTTLTAANFDAQAAAFLSLRDAIAAITLGLRIQEDLTLHDQIFEPTQKSSDPDAQRERKWLVTYRDGVADPPTTHKMEIPCADLSYLDANNRGYADPDDADVAAFISAFEAFVISPAGHAVSVVDIKHVGRNI